MEYSLTTHLDYHVWAQRSLAKALQSLDDELFYNELVSSFPSIAKTVLHLWDAETVWNKRLQEGISLDYWPSSVFTGSKQDILDSLVDVAVNTASFIASKDSVFMHSVLSYKSVSGIPSQTEVNAILFHMVNHASYHRGQIVTLLRQVGITSIPSFDLITYLRL